MKNKQLSGLQDFPVVEAGILGGIALDLMELDHMLRPVFFIVPYHGFYLKRRQAQLIRVMLRGNIISADYHWTGRYVPERPVPNKPGWVYRSYRSNESGYWQADVQDPEKFKRLIGLCEDYIRVRSAYLNERRQKAAEMRRLKKEQVRAAEERHEQWKARCRDIENSILES